MKRRRSLVAAGVPLALGLAANVVSAPRAAPSATALRHAEPAALVTAANGLPFNRIDPNWPKPTPVSSTIRVQDGRIVCGRGGDGGDTETNALKNRTDIPSESHVVTLDAIRSLDDTILWRNRNARANWTDEDAAAIARYEGIALTVEGYFEIVKPQARSAPSAKKKVGEATNCHSWDERDTDWHIALVASPSETEEQSIVVEPTPRTKRPNPGWDPDDAAALAIRHDPEDDRHEDEAARVRVTGFLLLDPVHVSHIRGGCRALPKCSAQTFYRSSLWELHPVTRIEVLRDNQWVDLGKTP